MDPFSYLSVILAVVLGLAITQILSGFRGLILTRAKIKPYGPTLIWAFTALLIPIQAWWADFAMHTQASWSFLALLVSLLQAISIYMIAALVLPDMSGETVIDLRQHFLEHRYWFFGAVLGSIVFSLLKTFVLSGHLPSRADTAFQFAYGAVAIAAAMIRSERFHKILAPIAAAMFIVYIAALFSRL